MTATSSRPNQSDLVPIADRMRLLQGFRTLTVAIAGIALWRIPGPFAPRPSEFAAVSAIYLVVGFATGLSWKWSRRGGLTMFGLLLMTDGLFLTWVSYNTGGPISPLRNLILLHVIAVALLASYRTGVKIALWHSLLLIIVYYLQQDRFLTPIHTTNTAPGTPFEQLIGFCVLLWIGALATAHFSATNERELRRSRYDIEALAHMAEDLERTPTSGDAANVLLTHIAETFTIDRGLVLASPDGAELRVLATRGAAPGAPDTFVPQPGTLIADVLASRQTRLAAVIQPSDQLDQLLPGARSVVVVPLTAESHSIGAIVVERTLRGTRIERRVVTMLERFAAYGSLALRNAWLLEQVQLLAETDPLTGLANRSTINQTLIRELARASHQAPVSLMMLDVDHFKQVNDTHGHQRGDDVLRRVAQRVATGSHSPELTGRYGGEEFIAVLPDTSPSAAFDAAERLRRTIADDDADPRVTISIGVATYPHDATDAPALIRVADQALYASKRGGRNQVTRASRPASSPAPTRTSPTPPQTHVAQ